MTALAGRSATPAGARSLSTTDAPALDLPARFMLVAMLSMLVVTLTAPIALPLLLGSAADPHLLAFIHLNTVGVVAMMAVGASYQLVPVALQTPLASPTAGRVSFWLLLAGVGLFVPGIFTLWLPAVAVGATLLLVGFGIHVAVVGLTVRRAPHHDVVAWHMAASLASLGAGVVLGVVLAFNMASGMLGGLTYRLVAAHATLMLGGWIAVLLAGVAYRLVGMFTLADDRLWRPLAWTALATSTLGAWLVALGFALDLAAPLRLAGAAGILAGQAAFAGQLLHLYRAPRRRGFEVSLPFVLLAATMGTGAAALLLGGRRGPGLAALGGRRLAGARRACRDGDPGFLLQDRNLPRLAPPLCAAGRAPARAAPGVDVPAAPRARRLDRLAQRTPAVTGGARRRRSPAGPGGRRHAERGTGLLSGERGRHRVPLAAGAKSAAWSESVARCQRA